MEIRVISKNELKLLLGLEKEYTASGETLGKIRVRHRKFPELFIGCFEDSELIGEISGFARDRAVIIQSIAVKHQHQRRGIGRRLLAYFEWQAKKYGKVVSVAGCRKRFIVTSFLF